MSWELGVATMPLTVQVSIATLAVLGHFARRLLRHSQDMILTLQTLRNCGLTYAWVGAANARPSSPLDAPAPPPVTLTCKLVYGANVEKPKAKKKS